MRQESVKEIQAELGDRYRMVGLLGSGAMGAVWKAVEADSGQEVAVKVLLGHLIGPFADRFRLEAELMAELDHPSVMEIYDYGFTTSKRPYLAMELLRGKSLRELLTEHDRRRAPIPVGVALRITRDVLEGLAYCHGRGVLHRDIKPDNLFVVDGDLERGRVKLLDFGVAKAVGDGEGDVDVQPLQRPTAEGQLLGTPFYMAPEQIRGQPIDHRVDVYSAGVLLYRMLTERRPFNQAAFDKLLIAQVGEPPAPPTTHRPELSAGIDWVTLKALAKSPDNRFASANEMIAALDIEIAALKAGVSAPHQRHPSAPAVRPSGPAAPTAPMPLGDAPPGVVYAATPRPSPSGREAMSPPAGTVVSPGEATPKIPSPSALTGRLAEPPVPWREAVGVLLATTLVTMFLFLMVNFL
ncbi:MAG: protein kinase [Myxococcota bacterium]